jgi:hypothetical protein
VLRLDIKKKRGDHRNSLLTRDVSNLGLGDQELVEFGILGRFLQQGTGDIVVPSKIIRVPSQRARGVCNGAVDGDVAQVRNECVLDRVTDLNCVAISSDP